MKWTRQRAACITAINAYHREHLRPLVVCSRTNEYTAATRQERLALNTAVVVQPLSIQQIDTYLEHLGEPLSALRRALKKNATLQEVATTPLMLQVLMLTYHGTQVWELSHKDEQLGQQIWTDYVKRMVNQKGDARHYSLPITIRWLSFLARQMRVHNQTIFILEYLHPDWVPSRLEILYILSIGLLIGPLLGWLSGLLAGDLFREPFVGWGIGPLVGLSFWGFFGLNREVKPVEVLKWSWKGFFTFLRVRRTTLFYLIFAPFFGLSGSQLTDRSALSPNEGIQRSLKNGLFLFVIGLFFGLLVSLAFGLFFDLAFGLFFGLVFGLFFGLGTVLQHYTLYFWLSRSGIFPWKAVPFLEDATSRILLRRVGGGYSFTHRLLLDYFADLDSGPPSPSAEVHSVQQTPQS